MSDFNEVRYPFNSAIEFFRDGYWRQPAAIHLIFAYIAVAAFVLFVLTRKKYSAGQKLVALYFCLTPFNNFAFQIGGASLGDFFGILASLYFVGDWVLKLRGWQNNLVTNFLLLTAVTFAAHALVVELIYPNLNDQAGFTRVALILKVFVLAFSVSLFSQEFGSEESIDWFVNQVVNFALLAIGVYFLQAVLLLVGIVPYGLYLGANFVPVPTFGGVSIERGHFGKFVTPLFPLFLIVLKKDKRWLAFAVFVLVTLVNISASSLIYFAGYSALAILAYRRSFWKAKTFGLTVPLVLAFVGMLIAARSILWSVCQKVIELAIEGDRSGGRGTAVLWEYLSRYPLGLSYGGSTLRVAANLDEINSGVLAFISQLSLLAPFILFALGFLVYRILRSGRIDDVHIRRALLIGIFMMFFIFFSDILWFVPTIWAPLVLYYQFIRKGSSSDLVPKLTPI